MKIAVCFWGLTRSLKYTIKSINEQLDYMRRFADVTTFMHTYKIFRPYSNIWGKENNITLDPNEYKILNPDHFVWDDQDEISKKIDFKSYHTFPDVYKTNWQTIDNFILAMYSMKRVTELMLRHNKKNDYDYVVFMRPDVIFDSKPYESYFKEATDDTIVSPSFGIYFGIGSNKKVMNDRYAICTPYVASIYGKRFNKLLEYSKKKQLHSETFVYDIMIESNIKILYKWICFNRVRANGEILNDCKTKY